MQSGATPQQTRPVLDQKLLYLARPFLLMFSWRGRAKQEEVAIVLGMLPLFLLPDIIFSVASLGWLVANFLLWLIIFTSTAVRRLHDSSRDAWTLLVILIPYIGILIFLASMIARETPGANVYGPDPRDIS